MTPAEVVLKEIEEMGERSFIPVIGPKKGRILDDAVMNAKPKLILEVGAFIGYSAIRMARVMQECRIITLEINNVSAERARKNIERAGFSDRVQIIVGDAKKTIPKLNGIFDLIFLDAEKTEYLTYLTLVEDDLRRGSVIVADNAGVFAKEMADYLSYVRMSGRYKSKYYESTLEFNDDIKDGVEVSMRL